MFTCRSATHVAIIVLCTLAVEVSAAVLVPGSRTSEARVSSTFRCLTCPEEVTESLSDSQLTEGIEPVQAALRLDGAEGQHASSFGIVDGFVHSFDVSMMANAPTAFSEFGRTLGNAQIRFDFMLEQAAEFDIDGRINFDSPLPPQLNAYSATIELWQDGARLFAESDEGNIQESRRLPPGDYELRLDVSAAGSTVEFGDATIDMTMSFLAAAMIGDLNGDQLLTAIDINLISHLLRNRQASSVLDLTGDGEFDHSDRDAWISQVANTFLGDSNLDGRFDSCDLIEVFQSGQYEDDIVANSGWAQGDWNGDGEFDSSDLVAAFDDDGYRKGPRDVAMSVPEPSAISNLLCGLIVVGVASIRNLV